MSSLLDTDSLPTLPYPAQTKTATTPILDIPTTAQLISFSDKLLLTISQHGKLAQWFSVPLGLDNPSVGEGYLGVPVGGDGEYQNGDGETGDYEAGGLLAPQNRFQARTLLGGGGGEREVWGGLIARCVAGLIVSKGQRQSEEGNVEERALIVGLGLVGVRFDGQEEQRRELFLRILELVSRVL